MMRSDGRHSPSNRHVILLGLVVALVLGACGSSTITASPSTSAPAPATPAATDTLAPPSAEPSATSTTTQTDTDWGRIWDSLPTGFPTILGATPSEEASDGPASDVLVVQGSAGKAIATFTQQALEGAGFTTEELNGPFEDGSFILDSAGT
ncbi:MAG: hypothetical protein H0T59_02810, partial [Chloroflexi bacterium]|nr:hypothetical protein [Chloroflexota bacterium]